MNMTLPEPAVGRPSPTNRKNGFLIAVTINPARTVGSELTLFCDFHPENYFIFNGTGKIWILIKNRII